MEIQNGFSFCFIDLLLCYLGIDILVIPLFDPKKHQSHFVGYPLELQ